MLRKLRLPNGVKCLYCKSSNVRKTEDRKKSHKCKDCVNKFQYILAKYSPNWMYIIFKAIHMLINLKCIPPFLLPINGLYIAIKGHSRLFVPSPRGDWRSFYIRKPSVKVNGTCLIVGATVGAGIISLAKSARKIIAIEPEPKNIKCLLLNVKLHNLGDKVIIVPKAAWSRKGIMKLYKTLTITGHTLKPEVDPDKPYTGETVAVEVDTLDNILSMLNIRFIDFCAINAEGAEFEILKGFERSIKSVKRISIACHSFNLLTQYKAFLEKMEFKVKILQGNSIYAVRS